MVKTLVRVTALAGALATPPALAAQGDARPITLDEAVRLARRNAPASVQARNQIRSTAAAVRTRYGAFLPTLSFGGGAQTQQGQRYSVDLDSIIRQDAPWRANHSLSSNLDLFSGGRRYFDLMTARANVDAAEATEVSQSFAIARDVKQQYFAVLAAREQQAAAKVQLEQAQQQLRAAVARVAAGAATMSDSLRSIIQVGNARLATLNADNALATANATLSRLVGSDAIVTASASDTATVASISMTDAQLFDLVEQGPAVKQSQAQVAAAKQGKRSALSPYLPTLSMGLSQSFTATEDGFGFLGDGRNKNLSTNLRLSFPLFNGLSREQQVVTARIAEENAEANLRDARLNARQQMVTQLGAFRTAEARVEIQRQSVVAGEEDLRVQQERYNLGAGTLLDLMTSQSTLITARQALIQARLDARTAKAQLEALVGRDL
ncbi:MAG: TolC family protein [Gemmatimonadaceae bacterium]|nr:TolC family protein [Gemmatimonadaceae bacterium]